jgi:hypothetical protein
MLGDDWKSGYGSWALDNFIGESLVRGLRV